MRIQDERESDWIDGIEVLDRDGDGPCETRSGGVDLVEIEATGPKSFSLDGDLAEAGWLEG